jgi:serine/threonine-protein kinase RsbW
MPAMPPVKILIIENDAALRASWTRVLADLGHAVTALEGREEALELLYLDDFAVIVSDLTDADASKPGLQPVSEAMRRRLMAAGVNNGAPDLCIVKAFKLDAASLARAGYDSEGMCAILEQVLRHKREEVDDPLIIPHLRERIDFALPSDVKLMHPLLDYLLERVAQLGVAEADNTHLFIALDEAFVNAVKHGNKFDPTKLVYISAEISAQEARFTIEDQGEGFDVHAIPDPLDPANLFKTSGRGVLLIHNIMDEVTYNERGNRVTLVKRPGQK